MPATHVHEPHDMPVSDSKRGECVCVCACATGRVSVSGNDAHIVDQHSFSRTGFDHHGCIMMGSVLNDRANDVALW